jgi:hypothetical protein
MSINFIPYRKDKIRTVSNSTSSVQVKNEYEPDFLSPLAPTWRNGTYLLLRGWGGLQFSWRTTVFPYETKVG